MNGFINSSSDPSNSQVKDLSQTKIEAHIATTRKAI